jgi:hypothetical protein
MFFSVGSATSVNSVAALVVCRSNVSQTKRRRHSCAAGVPKPLRPDLSRLALRHLRNVSAVVIVILVLAERGGVCAAATHTFNAEHLLVRLTIHDHADEVVTRIGGRCTRSSAAATTAAATTTTERRRRHSDDRPDAADRIERRVADSAAAATTTAAAASSRTATATAGTRRQRRRRRGIKSAERTESAAATAAATTRRLGRATTELLPLSRRMLARLSTGTTTAASSTSATTTATPAASRLLRIDEHADLCPNNANRGRVIAGLRQGIQHLRRACAKQNAVAPL